MTSFSSWLNEVEHEAINTNILNVILSQPQSTWPQSLFDIAKNNPNLLQKVGYRLMRERISDPAILAQIQRILKNVPKPDVAPVQNKPLPVAKIIPDPVPHNNSKNHGAMVGNVADQDWGVALAHASDSERQKMMIWIRNKFGVEVLRKAIESYRKHIS